MKSRFGPGGVHFFDRKSGLNILVDEISPPKSQWSVAPRYVSIALTNACELECPYCYASKKPGRLDHDAVIGWARELDEGGCFGLGFGGGEPTLFPRFADLCRAITEGTHLAVSLTTHGHRFSADLVKKLSGNVSFIRLSMDGIGATYEKLRGRSFAAFEQKIELVRQTSHFGINYVVNSDTIADLEAAADLAFEKGAQEMLLLPETRTDGSLAIDAGVLQRLSTWVNLNYDRCRLATSEHAIEALQAPRLPVRNSADKSFEFMHVDALGMLKMSAFEFEGILLDKSSSILTAIGALRQERSERAFAN